jgi:hypothetical protein
MLGRMRCIGALLIIQDEIIRSELISWGNLLNKDNYFCQFKTVFTYIYDYDYAGEPAEAEKLPISY